MTAIEVDDVHKTFGRGSKAVRALRGVRLRVERGEIYGLLGRNGAGKTTLVKTLLDISRPSSGTTRILGIDSREARSRRSVGFLPEDHRLPDYTTGQALLHFYARLSGVARARRQVRVAELLANVDLEGAAHQKVRGYSKGMKQRLGLAQALLHEPMVLFLDEPTDGVDPVGRTAIRAIIVREKAAGRTIFINSHLLSEVEQVCDRVAILDQGELVREGSVEALTRAERSYQLETAEPVAQDLLAAIAGAVVDVKANGCRLEVAVANDTDVDTLVDLLRANRVSIRRLEGTRTSLESIFLESVRGHVAGAADRAAAATGADGT